MKKTITRFVLTAVLIVVAVGCQKEEFLEPAPQTNVESKAGLRYTLYYTVDGVWNDMTYGSDAEWYCFMSDMTALARAGHVITLTNKHSRPNPNGALETIVFDTRMESEAIAWCKKMSNSGYTVSIRYYVNTKIYHCLATRHRDSLDQACTRLTRVSRG